MSERKIYKKCYLELGKRKGWDVDVSCYLFLLLFGPRRIPLRGPQIKSIYLLIDPTIIRVFAFFG